MTTARNVGVLLSLAKHSGNADLRMASACEQLRSETLLLGRVQDIEFNGQVGCIVFSKIQSRELLSYKVRLS